MSDTGIARIFMQGRSQAVRLPLAFRLPGDRVRPRRVAGGILLDTNAVIAVLNDRPAGIRPRLCRALSRGTSIAVSSVVLYELWYGVARSERRHENAERLRIFLSGRIDVVPFDADDAETAGDLRATLEAAGTPIGPYGTLVAAQALRSGATLVTANTAEFARVRGLAWQDWSAPPDGPIPTHPPTATC
jgi:tRNA(fMet)-specific endonuclease VapC